MAENPSNRAAWIDFKLSIPTLITILCLFASLVSRFSSLEARVNVLQTTLIELSNRMAEVQKETQRRDVADVQRAAIIERLNSIEKKIDSEVYSRH